MLANYMSCKLFERKKLSYQSWLISVAIFLFHHRDSRKVKARCIRTKNIISSLLKPQRWTHCCPLELPVERVSMVVTACQKTHKLQSAEDNSQKKQIKQKQEFHLFESSVLIFGDPHCLDWNVPINVLQKGRFQKKMANQRLTAITLLSKRIGLHTISHVFSCCYKDSNVLNHSLFDWLKLM